MIALNPKTAFRTRRGMSMMEVTIAGVISLLVIGAILSIFVLSSKMTRQAYQLNEIHDRARLLSDTLAKDIRHAGNLGRSFQQFHSEDSTLILELPAIDADGNPINVKNNIDRIVYYPSVEDPEILIREVIPDAESARSSSRQVFGDVDIGLDITGTFSVAPDPLGAHVIHYQFTVRRTLQGKEFEIPVAASVRLRNKVEG
jgi:hypothetical protein